MQRVTWYAATTHSDLECDMNKADMKVYKERLLQLRARLRGDVTAMANAALYKTRSEASGDLSSMPIHMADVGTDNFEQEFTLSLMENDEDTLGLIEAALERIEDGVYGACLECEGKIPKTRLNAIPFTAYCVKCASKLESR
jgi:DnaK suppressor protein